MSKSRIPEAQVDERAERLIHEFMDHFNDCATHDPTAKDRKREVFEAWAIQKIAGLQLAIEHLSGQLATGENGEEPDGEVPF
jgi:hypothetical protein